MKPETETAIRSIVSMDAEVTKEMLERAVDILRGKADSDEELVRVLRYKEVIDLLHIHRRTLDYYIEKGYLDRVYGRKQRALGISRDSFLRFTSRRVSPGGGPHRGKQEGVTQCNGSPDGGRTQQSNTHKQGRKEKT